MVSEYSVVPLLSMFVSPWSSPYCVSVFSYCSQKYIFYMVQLSHFGAGGERHGCIRRVLSIYKKRVVI